MGKPPEPKYPDGSKIPRGKQLRSGRGWRLISPGATTRQKAALLKTFTVKGERFAIFHLFDK